MQAEIRKYAPETEYFIDEQCHITELSNAETDPGVSIARARVEPGVSTHWHRLRDTAERYAIISGEGIAEIGNLPAASVGPGDIVVIPPMVRQRITNTGVEDLVFLAICSPRFQASAYEDLREER